MITEEKRLSKARVLGLSDMSKVRGGQWVTIIVDGEKKLVWVNP